MEYVPKHTSEKQFLMVNRWLFIIVFVVETIRIYVMPFSPVVFKIIQIFH